MDLYLAGTMYGNQAKALYNLFGIGAEGENMDLYMAGGINGNCKPMFADLAKAIKEKKPMDMYLAGVQGKGRGWCVDVYLAGENQKRKILKQKAETGDIIIDIAVLESFYYADEYTEWLIPRLKKFLLDSGAFTLFSSGKHIDWNDYLDKYIAFINRNDVKRFFELDIDSLVGYDKVLKFRERLERETGKKCIPVWHKSRGKDEFLKMCDEYDYVAIGGIVSKEITSQEYPYFPWFIREAHKRGAKIHGLGFTNLEGLKKYKFDSVDSTSWTTGNRFGAIYTFDGETMKKTNAPPGKGLKDARAAAIRNFNEWVKFQKYAEKNL